MIAVPAQAIWRQDRDVIPALRWWLRTLGRRRTLAAVDVAAGRGGLTLAAIGLGSGSMATIRTCRFHRTCRLGGPSALTSRRCRWP